MSLLGVALATLALSGAPAGTTTSAGALAPPSVCRGQAAPAAPPAVQLRAMRCLINWARTHAGRAALHPSTELDRSDRKSTRLNSSHVEISYAVFCLKKKK